MSVQKATIFIMLLYCASVVSKETAELRYVFSANLGVYPLLIVNAGRSRTDTARLGAGVSLDKVDLLAGFARSQYLIDNQNPNDMNGNWEKNEIKGREFFIDMLYGFYRVKDISMKLRLSYANGEGDGKFSANRSGLIQNVESEIQYEVYKLGGGLFFKTGNSMSFGVELVFWRLDYSNTRLPEYAKADSFNNKAFPMLQAGLAYSFN